MKNLRAPVMFVIIGIFLAVNFGACSSSKEVAKAPDESYSERISLNINEAVYFDFVKQENNWSGNLTIYTLNDEGEKVVKTRMTSVADSTWDDFGEFVNFLKLYEIPPQNEIEGWVPDSGELPRRVYNFEVFDGDTTRTYSYQDPINGIRNYWQSQNVLTFVTFIQNDLHWREVSE